MLHLSILTRTHIYTPFCIHLIIMKKIFSLSTYSLALMRICLWSLLIYDLIERRTWSWLFFWQDAVYSLSNVSKVFAVQGKRSLFLLTEHPFFVSVFFWLSLVVAVFFVIGYRTRLMTILLWIIIISLHNRIPTITNGGDIALRICLFWSMFLPLWAQWSIDSIGIYLQKKRNIWKKRRQLFLRDSRKKPQQYMFFYVASTAMIVQLLFVYITNYWLKTWSAWTEDFTATSMTLLLDKFTTPLWDRMSHYQWISYRITRWWIFLEWRAWIFVFFPRKNKRWRWWVVLLMIGMHLGMALMMELWLFSYVMMAWWLSLLPHELRNSLLYSKKKKWEEIGNSTERENTERENRERQKTWLWQISWQDWTMTGIVWFLFVYIVSRNMMNIDGKALDNTEIEVKYLAWVLRIDQTRRMFSPSPSRTDGRYDLVGYTADGQVDNLLLQTSYDREDIPADYSDTLSYWRFRKLFDTIGKSWTTLMQGFCAYSHTHQSLLWLKERRYDRIELISHKHIRYLNRPDKEIESEIIAEGECEW